MILMGLLDAGTAACQILQAGRLNTDHIQGLAKVVASLLALDILEFWGLGWCLLGDRHSRIWILFGWVSINLIVMESFPFQLNL
jgi:hypothetical protein